MPAQDEAGPLDRAETFGGLVLSAGVIYLSDVQMWEPHVVITRADDGAQPFVVPCGPECYRKNADEAFNAGWAAGRQWLDGGKIPWKAK